ncbi:MAG: hypothetical protein LKJ80_08235 [Oscillibacter sp.]|jgi:hypothetical protein|nr:hypothetical protein [Oscillibacter sp.]
MIIACLLLTGCGGGKAGTAADEARQPYREMDGCTAEAKVTCGTGEDDRTAFALRCSFVPEKTSSVEILAPETVAGIRASVDSRTLALTYADLCLDTGAGGTGALSPAACIPRILEALRDGWLLEENDEKLNGVPCLRLCLDQTEQSGEKTVTAVWLKKDGGEPVYGEISSGGKIILTAEFTAFQFGDILNQQNSESKETETAPASSR